jgi:immunity protein 52 of polymorphic toxin system
MNSGFKHTISAVWEPRAETPEALATRLINTLNGLKIIDSIFSEWYIWTSETTEVLVDLRPDALAKEIAQTAELDVNDVPAPKLGYRYLAINGKTDGIPQQEVFLEMQAGGSWRSPLYANQVSLRTSYGTVPDPRIAAYPAAKQMILVLADCFDTLWCSAYSSELADLWQNKRGPAFEIAWISYVAARAARSIQPPSSAIMERGADGSLLMAATTEAFDMANPAHLTVARDIEAAVAKLRAMPWPPPVMHDA